MKSFKALIDNNIVVEFFHSYRNVFETCSVGNVNYEYDAGNKECVSIIEIINSDAIIQSISSYRNYNVDMKILSEYYITFLFDNDIQKVPITFTQFMDDSFEDTDYHFIGEFKCGENEYKLTLDHKKEKVLIYFKEEIIAPIAKQNFVLINIV